MFIGGPPPNRAVFRVLIVVATVFTSLLWLKISLLDSLPAEPRVYLFTEGEKGQESEGKEKNKRPEDNP